jgi:hypothetical protein
MAISEHPDKPSKATKLHLKTSTETQPNSGKRPPELGTAPQTGPGSLIPNSTKVASKVGPNGSSPEATATPISDPGPGATNADGSAEIDDDLDEDEKEFRAQRRDMPEVTGSSAVGIVAINVSKLPAGKNEFFRTHTTFNPIVDLVDIEVGMERRYFTATAEMKIALAGIGITMSPHTLYLTVSETGAIRIVPIRCMEEDGNMNEYSRTKEMALIKGRDMWMRVYTDIKNKMYKDFPAPPGRFAEPVWPQLKHAKIFRLTFRDKGHCIDSPQHPLYMKWAGRAADKK